MKDPNVESGLNIYPGVICTKEDLSKIKNDFSGYITEIHKSKVKIKERKDFLEIEVIIPGVNKEDIYAEISNEILTVRIIRCKSIIKQGISLKHELYQRSIKLPKTADVLFTTAAYTNGILKFIIPKSKDAEIFNNERIVIY